MPRYSLSNRKRKRENESSSLFNRKGKKKAVEVQYGGSEEADEEPYLIQLSNGHPTDYSSLLKVCKSVGGDNAEIASLNQLRNISLDGKNSLNVNNVVTVDMNDMRNAQQTSFGYIKEHNHSSNVLGNVFNIKSIDFVNNISDNTYTQPNSNGGGLSSKAPVAGETYGVWCYGVKPPQQENSQYIKPYNNSFWSKNDYPNVEYLEPTPKASFPSDTLFTSIDVIIDDTTNKAVIYACDNNGSRIFRFTEENNDEIHR